MAKALKTQVQISLARLIESQLGCVRPPVMTPPLPIGAEGARGRKHGGVGAAARPDVPYQGGHPKKPKFDTGCLQAGWGG